MNVHTGHGIDPSCRERRINGQLLGECHGYALVDEGGRLAKFTLVDETVTVDGVVYDVEKIRTLVLERHLLASENNQLRRRLDRADLHLRRRTSALTRLIARKGTDL